MLIDYRMFHFIYQFEVIYVNRIQNVFYLMKNNVIKDINKCIFAQCGSSVFSNKHKWILRIVIKSVAQT